MPSVNTLPSWRSFWAFVSILLSAGGGMAKVLPMYMRNGVKDGKCDVQDEEDGRK